MVSLNLSVVSICNSSRRLTAETYLFAKSSVRFSSGPNLSNSNILILNCALSICELIISANLALSGVKYGTSSS